MVKIHVINDEYCYCVAMVTTTAQLYSTEPEIRLWAGSNPARSVLEIRDDEDLW